MCSTLEFKFNYFNWNIRTSYSSIKTSSTLSIAIPARKLRETVFTVVSGGVFSRALCAIRRNCLTSVRAYRRTTVASDTGGLLRTALCSVPIRSPNGDCDTVFTRAIESLVGWTGTCCRDRSIHLDEILVIGWVRVTFVADLEPASDWPDVEPFVLCALCDSGRERECCEWVHEQLRGTRLCARTPQGAKQHSRTAVESIL